MAAVGLWELVDLCNARPRLLAAEQLIRGGIFHDMLESYVFYTATYIQLR